MALTAVAVSVLGGAGTVSVTAVAVVEYGRIASTTVGADADTSRTCSAVRPVLW